MISSSIIGLLPQSQLKQDLDFISFKLAQQKYLICNAIKISYLEK